jgi:integrase
VADLKPRDRAYFHPDPEMPGHGVRVQPNGHRQFYVITRDKNHRQRWVKLNAPIGKIAKSRDEARDVIERLKAGETPRPAKPVEKDSVAAVLAEWVTRHVKKNAIRTGPEIERIIRKYILPRWRDRAFIDIRRSDIAALLDVIEDKHGASVADSVLAVLRSAASWFAVRHDDYTPPFVKRMRRVAHKPRDRALSDDELRKVWRTAESNGVFGDLVRILLLTAQRRAVVVRMRWDQIDGDLWRIPVEDDRAKGHGGDLRLPPQALAIINRREKFYDSPFVFTGRSTPTLSGFAKRKDIFDRKSGVTGWRLHDLRRTARSLMARAGVEDDLAERVLGHARPALVQTYNVHQYLNEKGLALKRLADLIEQIVKGEPGGNVLPLKKRAAARA